MPAAAPFPFPRAFTPARHSRRCEAGTGAAVLPVPPGARLPREVLPAPHSSRRRWSLPKKGCPMLWDGSFPKLRSEETRGERSLEFSSSAPSCSRSAEPLPCRPAGNAVGEPAAAAGAGPATAARELRVEAEHQWGPSEQSPGMGSGGWHCQGGAGCDVLRPLCAHCPGTSGIDSSIAAAQLLNPV